MKKQKFILGLILFVLGLSGIASMLTMDIPLPPEAENILKNTFTPDQIKLLILVNPTILLLIAVTIGNIFYSMTGLTVPILEGLIRKEQDLPIKETLKSGAIWGVVAGVALSLIGQIYLPYLPEDFLALSEKLKPTLAARFLYGGFTEEIMMRFGLMTFIIWVTSLFVAKSNPVLYWFGITATAVVFAMGHLPLAYNAVEIPSPGLISYIIIGNCVGGILFGWLYWKKGLESAFLAHMVTHAVMVTAEWALNSA